MKHYNKNLLFALIAVLAVSCSDAPFAEYKTEKPESLKKYEYLNEYDALKTYIDRTTHPNFKLGTGVTVSDFLKEDLVYTLVSNNYDELTPGNAMKYSSCVDKNGNMDFGTVKKFVKTAKEAGLSIYGHTLCWHSQQQNDYLNGLIADKPIEVDPDMKKVVQDAYEDFSTAINIPYVSDVCKDNVSLKDHVLTVENESATDFWKLQYQPVAGISTKEGGNYNVTLNIKGSKAGELTVGLGGWGDKLVTTKLSFTEQWQEVTVDLNGVLTNSSFVLLQSGDFVGTYEIKSVKVTHEEAVVNTVDKLDAEFDYSIYSSYSYWSQQPAGADISIKDKCLNIYNPTAINNFWNFQYHVADQIKWNAGTNYKITTMIRASQSGDFTVVAGAWGDGNTANTKMKVTTEWSEVSVSLTVPTAETGFVMFQSGNLAGNIEMKWLKVSHAEASNLQPIPDEEKKEILTNELDRWIKGMMEACGGYVKAWDVVNEPISGKDSDGDGFYNLQSAKLTDDNGVAGTNFYWQDYLGDDYARIPIALARKYFAEYGGNPDDLKLFINDYNLESDWDAVPNQKLKSLIHYIERWESDGVTKVDGIGTQMHVSYHMNSTTQTSKENAIVNMFTLLASSGKLVKITELDMGVVDVDGKTAILTENLTEEMQQKMSDFYQFIIEKYFEIIPVAQQYGITHWSPTDSPAESSWRKGQPIGLWDLNYNRKPVYVGFLEGLKNGTQGKTAAK